MKLIINMNINIIQNKQNCFLIQLYSKLLEMYEMENIKYVTFIEFLRRTILFD